MVLKLKDIEKGFLERSRLEKIIKDLRDKDPHFEEMFKNFKNSFLEADKETLLSVIYYLSNEILDLKLHFHGHLEEEQERFDKSLLSKLVNRLTFLEEDFRKIKRKVKRLG